MFAYAQKLLDRVQIEVWVKCVVPLKLEDLHCRGYNSNIRIYSIALSPFIL